MNYDPDTVVCIIVGGGLIYLLFWQIMLPVAIVGLIIMIIGIGIVFTDK